ncbi:hypothetical protein [Streptomyces sp. NPDC054838]
MDALLGGVGDIGEVVAGEVGEFTTVLTGGELDPEKINPIAARHHIRYEERRP